MWKKLLILGVVAFVLVLIFAVMKGGDSAPSEGAQSLVGDTLSITTFTHGKDSTNVALLRVPFLASVSGHVLATIFVDRDEDGAFSQAEALAVEIPLIAEVGSHGGTYVTLEGTVPSGATAQVIINGHAYSLTTAVDSVDVGTLLDLASITDPENAMKGIGATIAYAAEPLEIIQENVPDISQKPGECAPTAAANSLISLIGRHGKPADLPGTPEEIIEELKTDMKWTAANGVPPDDFVAGKNAWAKKHGLPIETKKVGDVHGLTTLDAVREALQNGSAVEMRIKFAEAGSNKAAGGHMVTVTGIHEAEGQTYLDLNDPYTPEGTETVELRANQLTNYGPWEGITVMSWAFTQTWAISGSEQSSAALDDTPIAVDMAFAHVKPGEYSEVYAVIITTPGNEVIAKLTGPAVDFKGTQHVIADENGQAHFTWKIYQYGEYTVNGNDEGGNPFTGVVNVQ